MGAIFSNTAAPAALRLSPPLLTRVRSRNSSGGTQPQPPGALPRCSSHPGKSLAKPQTPPVARKPLFAAQKPNAKSRQQRTHLTPGPPLPQAFSQDPRNCHDLFLCDGVPQCSCALSRRCLGVESLRRVVRHQRAVGAEVIEEADS